MTRHLLGEMRKMFSPKRCCFAATKLKAGASRGFLSKEKSKSMPFLSSDKAYLVYNVGISWLAGERSINKTEKMTGEASVVVV